MEYGYEENIEGWKCGTVREADRERVGNLIRLWFTETQSISFDVKR